MIRLIITDDGVSATAGPESGPWSIRERVEEAGGSVSMRSRRRGTKLSLQFPVSKARS